MLSVFLTYYLAFSAYSVGRWSLSIYLTSLGPPNVSSRSFLIYHVLELTLALLLTLYLTLSDAIVFTVFRKYALRFIPKTSFANNSLYLLSNFEKEQKDLEELINLQEDDIEKTLSQKFNSKKICNIMWK